MSVNSYVFNPATAGYTVLVTETGVEPLQLVARTGTSTFLLGGSRARIASIDHASMRSMIV